LCLKTFFKVRLGSGLSSLHLMYQSHGLMVNALDLNILSLVDHFTESILGII
jgi:hypothetical protein